MGNGGEVDRSLQEALALSRWRHRREPSQMAQRILAQVLQVAAASIQLDRSIIGGSSPIQAFQHLIAATYGSHPN